MNGCIAVDSSLECTGLMIMWKKEVQANLIAFSNIHIDVEISMGEEQFRGDFNEIIAHNEKSDGRRRPPTHMEAFRNSLAQNGLSNLKPHYGWFTWATREAFGFLIRGRLDWVVACSTWLSCFPDFRVCSVFSSYSDHCVLLLNTVDARISIRRHCRSDYFRYDTCWAAEPMCTARVTDAWTSSARCGVADRLRVVGQHLDAWQKKTLL
ncbi:hypothetical protein V6N13_138134 [Hibiscus sabdariffa]